MSLYPLDLSVIRPPPGSEIPPVTGPATSVVIILHGLGDTSQGIPLEIANDLRKDPALSHVKWILPQAPSRVIKGLMNQTKPAWYDMFNFAMPLRLPKDGEEDAQGMLHTAACVDALLSELIDSGIDPSRIALGGFSQGAAMTLLTGLTTTKKLGGLFVISGRLPLRNKIKSMVSEHASSLPVFWAHGTSDTTVKYQLARVSADFLRTEAGFPTATRTGAPGIDFHSYHSLPHYIRDDELSDLASFLKKILPPVET
ncbi:lysophospholipase I [Roridomyces roridus]|uniref:Acyl-protein thioesterase 1 n=1 Tax=Roridomyces roridus TaxID=1738132 RepID=A0AAD7BYZ9_9AGAR|nr:lysophospholipase I [Roridomyces roridus]